MEKFYIYIHTLPDGSASGLPFYVGKGSGKRSHSIMARSDAHRAAVISVGINSVGIYRLYCNSEEQAFAFESWMIDYGLRHNWPLVNIMHGRKGKQPQWPKPKGKFSKMLIRRWKSYVKLSPRIKSEILKRKSVSLLRSELRELKRNESLDQVTKGVHKLYAHLNRHSKK